MKFVTVLSISFLVFQLFKRIGSLSMIFRRIGSLSIIKYIKASTKSFPPPDFHVFLDTQPNFQFCWTLPDSHVFFETFFPIPMLLGHLIRYPCFFVTPCISLCKVYYPMLLIFQELMFQPIPTPHLNSQGRTNP